MATMLGRRCVVASFLFVLSASSTPDETCATDIKQLEHAAKLLVESTISQNQVVVFSKSYCPYSRCNERACVSIAVLCCRPSGTGTRRKAKTALFSLLAKQQVHVEELDEREDGGRVQDALQQLTGRRSVPRVFVDGTFIGGGDETHALLRSGELKALLQAKGIPVVSRT